MSGFKKRGEFAPVNNPGYRIDLGLMGYQKAWDLQHRLWEGRVKGALPDILLFVEHSHVITLGRRGNRCHLVASQEVLEQKGVEVFHVERGGDVTYHGPGQMVVYPIFHLKEYGYRLLHFVEQLEEVVIRTLSDFEIEGRRDPRNRGVWVGSDKIASVGVAIKRWVSFHGIALNYETDLNYFDLINPCGLEGVKMASMAKVLGKGIPKEKLADRMYFHFRDLFPRDWDQKEIIQVLPPSPPPSPAEPGEGDCQCSRE
jgi:lipoate-protein ligase B